MASKIHLAKLIVDRANSLFKDVYEGRLLVGKPHDAITTACLYLACRQEGVPRTFKVSFTNPFFFLNNLNSSSLK